MWHCPLAACIQSLWIGFSFTGLVNKFIKFFYHYPKSTKNDGRNGSKIAINDGRISSFLETLVSSISNKGFGKCGKRMTSVNYCNHECNFFISFKGNENCQTTKIFSYSLKGLLERPFRDKWVKSITGISKNSHHFKKVWQ